MTSISLKKKDACRWLIPRQGDMKTEGLVWGYNKKCSFGLMEFDTTAEDPTLRFEVHSIDGERIHSHQIKRSQLRFSR